MKLKAPNLTYRTRKRLKTAGLIVGGAAALGTLVWLCWVLWLGRFVVYSREEVKLDFDWVTPGEFVAAVPPEKRRSTSSMTTAVMWWSWTGPSPWNSSVASMWRPPCSWTTPRPWRT